jgi:class 3 adenylate cyclase/tetratricopeptide (TPR) repeat protein
MSESIIENPQQAHPPTAPVPTVTTSISLRRHIPELAIDWALDTPEQTWKILEGTLCFADVSGFTALAERLAQRGRMGGEELVSRLGGVFGTMLDLAKGRGGMLLKFGGDALLLFFQGPNHAMQAACAAVEMRQALKAAAATPTSVGPLKLSMSVGLHSGPAHFYLIGSTHRELVLLGPAADAVVATESAANAGEIGLSPTTLALLPATASKPREDGLPLLRWRRPPVPACGPHPQREASEELLRGLFPRVLGEFLAHGVPEPEHRVACMAFIRFSGTDALLNQGGPEAVAAALDATVGAAQDCFADEAVSLLAIDVDHDGGKLFLGSGVPYAQEDDEGNMLRALRRIADLDLPLTLQMGVNRGYVFAAEVGAPTRAAYSAMGDTTNTAARITGKAPPGQIYAHPSVLDESLAVFEVEPAPPLTLKGKKAPLVVYRVGAAAGTRRREGLTVTEFFGREEELETLGGAISQVLDGFGSVWSVVGDAGIGKSRLIQEALQRSGVQPLLALRGEPHASGAYAMFRSAIRPLLGLDGLHGADATARLMDIVTADTPDLVPMAALLGDLMGVQLEPSPEVASIEPKFRAARTADVLVGLLASRYPGPHVIVADDVQWCDESSATLLGRIVRAAQEHAWLVLVSRRIGTGGFSPGTTATDLSLGPMAPERVKALVRLATEAAPLRPHELDLVVERAGGNPLFALEILRAARDIGSFDAVPQSLEAAMAAQVDALDAPARRLLRYASVLGRSFPREVLVEALRSEGQTVDDAALARLQDFLEEDGPGRLRFRSGIIRDTTYESVSYQLRRRLHGNIAETLERMAAEPDAVADLLAPHFARAEDHAKTWHYAVTAADAARERYANAEAVRFYSLALESARRLSKVAAVEHIEVWFHLGMARLRAGLLEAAVDAYNRAIQLADDDWLRKAELLSSRATPKWQMRNVIGAIRDLQAGIRLLKQFGTPSAEAKRATLEHDLAWMYFNQGSPSKALKQAGLAAEHARAAGNPHALAASLAVAELASLMLTGPGDGLRLKEALALFESTGDLRMLAANQANLGVVYAMGGRWRDAVDCFEKARGLYHRLGDFVGGAGPAANVGEILVKQGRFAEAEPLLKSVIEVYEATHSVLDMNQAKMQLARILIERAALAEADSMLATVERQFQESGDNVARLAAAAVRAFGFRRAGDPQMALDILERAWEAAGSDAQLQLPVVAYERATALAALNRPEVALQEVEVGLAAAKASGLPYEEALLLTAKADLARSLGLSEGDARASAQKILGDLGVVLG